MDVEMEDLENETSIDSFSFRSNLSALALFIRYVQRLSSAIRSFYYALEAALALFSTLKSLDSD